MIGCSQLKGNVSSVMLGWGVKLFHQILIGFEFLSVHSSIG